MLTVCPCCLRRCRCNRRCKWVQPQAQAPMGLSACTPQLLLPTLKVGFSFQQGYCRSGRLFAPLMTAASIHSETYTHTHTHKCILIRMLVRARVCVCVCMHPLVHRWRPYADAARNAWPAADAAADAAGGWRSCGRQQRVTRAGPFPSGLLPGHAERVNTCLSASVHAHTLRYTQQHRVVRYGVACRHAHIVSARQGP